MDKRDRSKGQAGSTGEMKGEEEKGREKRQKKEREKIAPQAQF